jgi:hypothetical protein
MAVSYVPYLLPGTRKSAAEPPDPSWTKISRQIDELQRLSRRERDEKWGTDWVRDMKDFHSLSYAQGASPSYRPRVCLPELQYLMMSEATDLTNDSPKVYISIDGKRDESREMAFASCWRSAMVNNRIFDAVLWSQYCNPSFLHVGFNPNSRSGKGMVWVDAIDPDSFDADPHAHNDKTWQWTVREHFMYIDEIRRWWPERAKFIRTAGTDDDDDMTGGYGVTPELPPGSLRIDAPEGFESQRKGPRLKVRYCWVNDYTRERVEEIAGKETADGFSLVVEPREKWKFPHGRMIIECNQVVLADGPNFVPKLPDDDFSTFPFIGIWSIPHLDSLYGVSPIRYGRSAQDLAERMYTQLFESMVRTNNAQHFIPEDSGIDIDAYGGLPGEVQVYRGDKVPEMKWPTPMPQHMVSVPELLLQKVDRYQGFTDSRQGQASAGNVSSDLFDASVFQSQTITRMKARMLSESIQRLAQMLFAFMVEFKTEPDTFYPSTGKEEACTWQPVPDGSTCELFLDKTSVMPMSSTELKKLVMALAKTPLALPKETTYEIMGIPNAKQVAEDSDKQQEVALLSKLKRPR